MTRRMGKRSASRARQARPHIGRVASALGASRVVDLRAKVEHTPFGMLALTDQVRRLRSTGPRGTGRPGDPEATVARIVKFKPGVWGELRQLAQRQARLTGRQVSPAQVASIVLEQALKSPGARRQRREAK